MQTFNRNTKHRKRRVQERKKIRTKDKYSTRAANGSSWCSSTLARTKTAVFLSNVRKIVTLSDNAKMLPAKALSTRITQIWKQNSRSGKPNTAITPSPGDNYESFHKLHLPSQSSPPLYNLLNIEDAGGQAVSCLGYTDLSIFFPVEIAGKPEIHTFVLNVPDCRANRGSPVLVGTNVLDVLYEIYTACRETSVSNKQVHCTNTLLIKKCLTNVKLNKTVGGLEKESCSARSVLP